MTIIMATNSTFAERLTELRKNSGKKRQEVADDLEISRASLEYYEKGKRKPDTEVLLKLAEYYNVTCDYLLKGVKTENVSINKVTGLSDEAIELLKLYNRIKLAREEHLKILSSNGTECNDNYYAIDIISYLIEHLHEYEIFYPLIKLATINSTLLMDYDIEEEILAKDKDLYDIIYSHGTVVSGHHYANVLENQAERQFGLLVSDFVVDTNPFEKERASDFRFRHEDSKALLYSELLYEESLTADYLNGEIPLDTPKKEGADDGNNPKTQ